ncbi:fibronectin type III domain-containing protein [archaeon]|nr:MAG: fibronectin type III domain-containing protein [archaeon]
MGGVIGLRNSAKKYNDVMDTLRPSMLAAQNAESKRDDEDEDGNADGSSSESSIEDKVPADVAWSSMFQDKSSKQLQELAIKFVSDNIYYAVPVRSNTRMNGYKPLIWIEPLPHLIEEALAGKGSLDKDLVDGLPTGVLINSKGAITIYFSLLGIEYKISRHYVQLLDKTIQCTAATPLPPKLKGASQNSLTISWYKELPLPAGIVQTVEVHYTAVEDDQEDKFKWQVLVTKQYQKSLFYEFTHSSLLPGHMYRFRLR